MNRNYLRGRAKEYQVINKFKKEGYPLVIRTAGSHSPIDVIAIKEMLVDKKLGLCFTGTLVQIKSSKHYKKFTKKTETIETPNGSIIYERWNMPLRV